MEVIGKIKLINDKIKLKTFKEVKDLVMQDFIAYRSDQFSQQFIDELRNEYTVAISPNFNLN